ncbi:OmpA family protein [Porphyromonas canoris]|uniref:OmpA-like domain-containing protein n=1 Tax=Porphyromonas canoris TaxID=36875 RepID=A0ABR4XLP5_9PORP|nr:OmpA family protein [Porphyromonas canoris]KGN92407.1 hypothetical protein HQ43_05135 [Porphyromonas canoris]
MKNKVVLMSLALFLGAGSGFAQTSKAIEISFGAKTIAYPRLSLLSAKHSSLGYQLALEKQELLLGLNASVTQELSPHWGVQLGQSLFKDKGIIALIDLQVEHRFGAYFARSAYIDPYIGLGISYFYNGVSKNSFGQGSVEGKPIVWQAEAQELWQKRHSLPLSATIGARLWLNDRWGMKLDASYTALATDPHRGAWSAGLGLSYRIGGRSKMPQAKIQYIDRYLEQIIEKPILIEKQVPIYISEVLEGIYFDFGSSELSEASMPLVERLAQWMRQDISKRFLITGCTDIVGAKSFNEQLSLARAQALASALVARGIAEERIKCRGVGKRIALAPKDTSIDTRSQDRKILLEVVSNEDYWRRIE